MPGRRNVSSRVWKTLRYPEVADVIDYIGFPLMNHFAPRLQITAIIRQHRRECKIMMPFNYHPGGPGQGVDSFALPPLVILNLLAPNRFRSLD